MLELTPRDVALPHRAKYLQLADAIRTAISDGWLKPGQRLPSEARIAEMVRSSKAVVRQSFDVLESQGIIERRNGIPARVSRGGKVRELSPSRYHQENARILAGDRPDDSAFTRGHGIEWDDYRIDLEIKREIATPKDQELLQLDDGAYVWRRYYVKYAGGQPVELQRSALPEWVVKGHESLVDPAAHPPKGGTQWELAAAGYRPTRVTEHLWPRMPHEDENRDLRIAQVPVLDVERVFWVGERPVEASRLVLPGSRHRLRYETILSD